MSPNPVPGTPSPSGDDAADRKKSDKPDFSEQIKTLGLAGAVVTAVVAVFKGAINSPEFKQVSGEFGEAMGMLPSVLKDELTRTDSSIIMEHRGMFERFEGQHRSRAEEERRRAFPHLRCASRTRTALMLPLYPVRLLLWFMVPAPLWTVIRRSAREEPRADRTPLGVLFGAISAFVEQKFQIVKLEVVFAYIGLLVVEMVKWVGTILFGIWRHMVAYNAWHTLGDGQTVAALWGMWVAKILFPVFGFWLVASALHYAYWLRMFPNLAIVGGFLGFLKGSRPRPKAKDGGTTEDHRGIAGSVGEGAGNMVFTWSTKGQNEGMWYNVCTALLLLVPFFMLWHPAFMFGAAVAIVILWQASTNLGNNMTAEGYRVVEEGKTYKALMSDPDKPGQQKEVTGHKYARAPSHWYVVYASLGVISLLIVVSFVNFGMTFAALTVKETRQTAIVKLTDQEVEAYGRERTRELGRLNATIDKVVGDMNLRTSLVSERSQVANIMAPDGAPTRLRIFNAEKRERLGAIDAKLAKMATDPDLRMQLNSAQDRIVALQSVNMTAVRDSIREAVGESMTTLEAVGIAQSPVKMTTRERYNFRHQEWVRAVSDSMRWRTDSLRMREERSRVMAMPGTTDSTSVVMARARNFIETRPWYGFNKYLYYLWQDSYKFGILLVATIVSVVALILVVRRTAGPQWLFLAIMCGIWSFTTYSWLPLVGMLGIVAVAALAGHNRTPTAAH